MMSTFWNSVVYILKIMGPLVRVLRIVDNEKKPAMPYIYEAMDRAKETIVKSFNGNEKEYKNVLKIIDERWECQLHQPLHAAGHYLNPEFFYANQYIVENDDEVVQGLYKCIDKLIPEASLQDKIMEELSIYKKAEQLFGNKMASRSRNTKSPAEWWRLFGCSAPNLQSLAIKICSLTCSATGCERNWSVFEHIHSKKRNRLSHKKLQDLVYVKYNQALKARHDSKTTADPIKLQEIDDCNEWLVGKKGANLDAEDELVHDDADLTWGDVERAAGVGEPRITTRQVSSSKATASNSRAASALSSRTRPPSRLNDIEEDDEYVDDVDDEDGYDDNDVDGDFMDDDEIGDLVGDDD